MPVYIRKDVSYTPPSLDKIPAEQEDDYINDPDLLKDTLPQPYRMIDKTVRGLIEDAWDVISTREEERLAEARKYKPPTYDSQIQLEGPVPGAQNSEKQNLSYATCMCDSPDGFYVFIGLPSGLVAVEAHTQQFTGSWEDPTAEIVYIKSYTLAQDVYLIVTIDDMGVGRLFAFGNNKFFLLKVLNPSSQDSDPKVLVSKLEASSDGDYMGVVMENSANQEIWLEVQKMPRDTWVSDLDTIITAMRKKEEEKKEEQQSELDTESMVASEITTSQGEPAEPSVASLPTNQPPSDTQEQSQRPVPKLRPRVSFYSKNTPRMPSVLSNASTPRSSGRVNLYVKSTLKSAKRSGSRPGSSVSAQGIDPSVLNLENQPKAPSTGRKKTLPEEKSDPLSGDFKFGSPQLIMKVKPPAPTTGVTVSNLQSSCQKIDSGDVVGTGQSHIFTQAHLDMRQSVFDHLHDNLLKYLPQDEDEGQKVQQYPHFHFLTPGRMLPMGLENASLQGRPTIVAVWWPGSTNFMQYSLIKTSKDIEFKPDLVWPFTSMITCSEVSPDSNLIAVGMDNGNVAIWDKYMGTQRGVISISDTSAIVKMRFLDPSMFPQGFSYYPPYRTKTGTYLLVMTANSAMYSVSVAPGMPLLCSTISLPVEKDIDTITMLEPFCNWPDLLLTVTQKGDIQIRDTLQGNILCQVKLPEKFEVLSPWEPVLALGGEGHFLYVKGTKTLEEDGTEAETEAEDPPANLQSGLVFIYHLKLFPSLDEYWKIQRTKLPFTVHTTIDQRVEALMADRIAQQPMRKDRMQERWARMKEEINSIHSLREQARINAEKRPLISFQRVVYPHYTFCSILSSDISLETSFQDVYNDMSHDRIGQEQNKIY